MSPDAWVERHGDLLFRFALLRVNDRQTAQDLVQETLLAALRRRKSFAGRSSERTWLVGILKHKIIDHYRRQSRDAAVPDTLGKDFDGRDHWVAGPRDWDETPEALVESKAFRAALEGCLQGLPGKARAAFSMRDIDELDASTVCKALKITPTNLWVLLHRARHRLRRCLEVKWFEKKGL